MINTRIQLHQNEADLMLIEKKIQLIFHFENSYNEFNSKNAKRTGRQL